MNTKKISAWVVAAALAALGLAVLVGPGLHADVKPLNAGMGIANSGGAPGSTYKSAQWVAPDLAQTTSTLIQAEMTAVPIYLPTACTITDLAVECVTTAGGAGSVVRLGVYGDDGTGYPGALLSDSGTVDTTTTGVKTLTLGTALSLGAGRYWLVAVAQGAPTPLPTCRIDSGTRGGRIFAQSASGALGSNCTSYKQASITGALPATFTATPAVATYSIRIAAKLG